MSKILIRKGYQNSSKVLIRKTDGGGTQTQNILPPGMEQQQQGTQAVTGPSGTSAFINMPKTPSARGLWGTVFDRSRSDPKPGQEKGKLAIPMGQRLRAAAGLGAKGLAGLSAASQFMQALDRNKPLQAMTNVIPNYQGADMSGYATQSMKNKIERDRRGQNHFNQAALQAGMDPSMLAYNPMTGQKMTQNWQYDPSAYGNKVAGGDLHQTMREAYPTKNPATVAAEAEAKAAAEAAPTMVGGGNLGPPPVAVAPAVPAAAVAPPPVPQDIVQGLGTEMAHQNLRNRVFVTGDPNDTSHVGGNTVREQGDTPVQRPVAVGPQIPKNLQRDLGYGTMLSDILPPVQQQAAPVQHQPVDTAALQRQMGYGPMVDPLLQQPGQTSAPQPVQQPAPVAQPAPNVMADFAAKQQERYNLDPSDPRYLAPGQTTAAMRFAQGQSAPAPQPAAPAPQPAAPQPVVQNPPTSHSAAWPPTMNPQAANTLLGGEAPLQPNTGQTYQQPGMPVSPAEMGLYHQAQTPAALDMFGRPVGNYHSDAWESGLSPVQAGYQQKAAEFSAIVRAILGDAVLKATPHQVGMVSALMYLDLGR